jgi:hypothetical protein
MALTLAARELLAAWLAWRLLTIRADIQQWSYPKVLRNAKTRTPVIET